MRPDCPLEERILILAPAGANAKTTVDVLERSGFSCLAVEDISQFCRYLAQEAGAAIILNERLSADDITCIRDVLQNQPPWSNLPLILLTHQRTADLSTLKMFGSHQNITALGLPIHTDVLIGLVRSLLEMRRRQYENRDLINELQRTRDELLRLKSMLETKNKELESIIGIVSHDLRAPIVNIQGFGSEMGADCKTLQTLFSGIMDEDAEKDIRRILENNLPESLHYIQTSAEAMNNLVVTLIEVARAGLSPTKPEKLDMNELMAEIFKNLKMKFREAHVAYDFRQLPDCFADRTQVTQIFTNLLDNAVKYLDPARPGQICVEGALQAGGSLYWVSDNGIGISPQDQQIIFEPYYQLKEKAAGGMGLGLATVKKMVDRNNGTIWVLSEKDKGSTFYVALPAVDISRTDAGMDCTRCQHEQTQVN